MIRLKTFGFVCIMLALDALIALIISGFANQWDLYTFPRHAGIIGMIFGGGVVVAWLLCIVVETAERIRQWDRRK